MDESPKDRYSKKIITANGAECDVRSFIESTNYLADLGLQIPRLAGMEIHSLCPFHSESRPSFYINIDTGVYFCHSCGASGGITSLVKRISGKDIFESDFLDKKRRPVVKNRQFYIDHAMNSKITLSPGKIEIRKRDKNYYKISSERDHQITPQECAETGLECVGFALPGSNLYGEGILIPVGVCRSFEEDIKNGMFQIRCFENEYIKSKYLNAFPKSSAMFGYRRAVVKKTRKKYDCIFVTEGAFDAIRLEREIGENALVVSSFSATMSDQQIGMAIMLSDNIVIAFDNDDSSKFAGDKFFEKMKNITQDFSLIYPSKMYRCKPISKDFGSGLKCDFDIAKNLITEVLHGRR